MSIARRYKNVDKTASLLSSHLRIVILPFLTLALRLCINVTRLRSITFRAVSETRNENDPYKFEKKRKTDKICDANKYRRKSARCKY